MNRFKKILYLANNNDNSEWYGLAEVQNLARLNDASVCVISVVCPPHHVLSQLLPGSGELLDHLIEDKEKELDQVAYNDGWQGIDLDRQVLSGKDFIVVVQKVLRDGYDLLVVEDMSIVGMSQLTMKMIRKCPCPVWIVRKTMKRSCKKILAAVDFESDSEESRRLNQKIVELSHSLAQRENGEAYYLHAWQLDYEAMLRSPRFNLQSDEVDVLKKELCALREKELERLFVQSHISPQKERIHFVEGETVEVIKRKLMELDIDILVMGTVARAGISGLLIGNKAERLLTDIGCSVLAVKPANFVSPVTLD